MSVSSKINKKIKKIKKISNLTNHLEKKCEISKKKYDSDIANSSGLSSREHERNHDSDKFNTDSDNSSSDESDNEFTTKLQLKNEKIKELENIFKNFGLEELLILKTPNYKLHFCECIKLTKESDFEKIPKNKGGIYFITTNENIHHSFHNKNKKFPKMYDDFTIIYNGTSSDLYSRAKNHLFRDKNKGMSGISVDILTTKEQVESHTKCCFSSNKKKKTPFIIETETRISEFNQCYKLNTSENEQKFLSENKNKIIYFRNGINVLSEKHINFEWNFYYLIIKSHSVRDIVETNWRKKYGTPILCTYHEGR